MPPITGQSIFILGGSSGIGFAIAELCLQNNARVGIASSSQSKLDDALSRLQTLFPESSHSISAYAIDLLGGDVEACLERLLSTVTNQGQQPFDHMINTAGRPEMRNFADIDLPFLIKSAQLPVFVPLLLAKVGAKYLKEGHTSSMIFTSGQLAERPLPGQAVMMACATAINGLTKNLACDLAPRRVNCVSPGATATELWGDHAEMFTNMAVEKSLLGKPGTPAEVAEAYLYLMKNTDATGSIVNSNGGSVLR
ncbi:enoyl-(Acyl carrier protein) reductase domain-containing protein [Sarocladium implicatum]|nr:enoyl-(Acyl carrier protein) reductase domain-containing protein [Sarocladium implicatum]